MTNLSEQMEGSVMSFGVLDSSEYLDSGTEYDDLRNTAVYDFRSLDYSDLQEFFDETPSAFEIVNVDPNHKIETVAYNRYKDKNYWDLLMLLNDRNMIEDMPKNNDLVIETVTEIVDEYFKNYQGPIKEFKVIEGDQEVTKTIKDFYKEYLLEKKLEENFEKQKFIALKPEYKKQFLRTTKYKI